MARSYTNKVGLHVVARVIMTFLSIYKFVRRKLAVNITDRSLDK